MKRVTLYSLSTCPACKKVKSFLNENGIAYSCIETDTLDSSEQWVASKELARHNPASTYPTLIVEEVITGFDIETLKAKLL